MIVLLLIAYVFIGTMFIVALCQAAARGDGR